VRAFDEAKRNRSGYEYRCKSCKADERRARKAKDPEKYKKIDRKRYEENKDQFKSNQLKYEYGITLDQKCSMYKEQKGLCGLCGKPLPEDFRKACTDHDHETGKVRALLHKHCNTIVGYEETNSGILLKAIDYKKHWESENA